MCKIINNAATCTCAHGFNGSPASTLGCSDVDECSVAGQNICGYGSVCKNEPGSFRCECPKGFDVNPSRDGCVEVKSHQCSASDPCPHSEKCVKDPQLDENVCVCEQGFKRDPQSDVCVDVNECIESSNVCGINAICTNTIGSHKCSCPDSMVGNPFSECKGQY